MDVILEELLAGVPDRRQLARVIVRLVVAMLLGAVIGIQRERSGKPAGLRTHMLVALGATLLVLGPLEFGMGSDGVSRVIQGLVTGIGFLGGGAILKRQEEHEIEGLTTAAGIWMTSAVGVAVGLGRIGLAIVSIILTLMILTAARKIENRIGEKQTRKDKNREK